MFALIIHMYFAATQRHCSSRRFRPNDGGMAARRQRRELVAGARAAAMEQGAGSKEMRLFGQKGEGRSELIIRIVGLHVALKRRRHAVCNEVRCVWRGTSHLHPVLVVLPESESRGGGRLAGGHRGIGCKQARHERATQIKRRMQTPPAPLDGRSAAVDVALQLLRRLSVSGGAGRLRRRRTLVPVPSRCLRVYSRSFRMSSYL